METLDAQLDHERGARTGVPEVVYGAGKTSAQTIAALRELHARNGFALATRVPLDQRDAIVLELPDAILDPRSGAVRLGRLPATGFAVAVVCAGTSDLPVAEEAAFTLEAFGHDAVRIVDVGVAGIHRLFDCIDDINACRVAIVVAGMEGALPSVVAGLTAAPVIAVPTSVGYGAAFDGIAALLGMMTACAPGIGVVNIDNGFGAAALAHKMLSRVSP
jgi:NCAIR mutase (PurE)-related protein